MLLQGYKVGAPTKGGRYNEPTSSMFHCRFAASPPAATPLRIGGDEVQIARALSKVGRQPKWRQVLESRKQVDEVCGAAQR